MISPNDTPSSVRERLRSTMEQHGLSVKDVAELIICQQSTVYGYLNGNDPMPPSRLDHLLSKLKQRSANGK